MKKNCSLIKLKYGGNGVISEMKTNNVSEITKLLIKNYDLKFNSTQEAVFINHLEAFFDRLKNNLDVGIEINDELRTQINQEVWEKARFFVKDFLNQTDLDNKIVVPETELFLIATHLALL